MRCGLWWVRFTMTSNHKVQFSSNFYFHGSKHFGRVWSCWRDHLASETKDRSSHLHGHIRCVCVTCLEFKTLTGLSTDSCILQLRELKRRGAGMFDGAYDFEFLKKIQACGCLHIVCDSRLANESLWRACAEAGNFLDIQTLTYGKIYTDCIKTHSSGAFGVATATYEMQLSLNRCSNMISQLLSKNYSTAYEGMILGRPWRFSVLWSRYNKHDLADFPLLEQS